MTEPTPDLQLRAELQDAARTFLDGSGGIGPARAVVDGEQQRGAVPLDAAIAELGWFGVEVPEEQGGLGAGVGELVAHLEELGRVTSPVATLGPLVLGIGALLDASDEQRDARLPAAAEGAVRYAVALDADGAHRHESVHSRRDGDGRRLDGRAWFVPDAETSDAIVVATAGEHGRELVVVDRDAAGLTVVPVPTVDRTRRLAHLELDGVTAGADAVLDGPGDPAERIARLHDRAALALAADAVGGIERVLAFTLEHLMSREQFGRPIGSFQALKHRCSDMFLAQEASRAALQNAVDAFEQGSDTRPACSVAKAYAGDAYVRVAADAVQLLGGIGFTWEHDAHIHLKRARLGQSLYGDSAWHRVQLGRRMLETA